MTHNDDNRGKKNPSNGKGSGEGDEQGHLPELFAAYPQPIEK